MSGYAFMLSGCFLCGRLFTYNPIRVPSIPIDPATGKPSPTGVRQPICRECVEIANPIRKARGLEEFVIYPDSYEAVEEGEL